MEIPKELTEACFTISELHGFDRTIGVARHDPSNILYFDGKYHLWYTRFEHRERWEDIWLAPNHTEIWLAVSADGWNWREVGNVMEGADAGFWAAAGRHAPHLVPEEGRYYMFFTAHLDSGGPFDKRLGLAVADRPEGPFNYYGDGPLLPGDADSEIFDLVGQDDACVIRRSGHYRLYFKGYGLDKSENRVINNHICLAIADKLTGPYKRFGGNPVTESHTGCVWPHCEGVALISDRGTLTVRYSEDGEDFRKASEASVLTHSPHLQDSLDACRHFWHVGIADPGVFCPDCFTGSGDGKGISWGVSQLPDVENAPAGGDLQPHWYPFLVRFDCDLQESTGP